MLLQLWGACSGPPGSNTGPAGAAAALPGRPSALGAHSWPPGGTRSGVCIGARVWGLDLATECFPKHLLPGGTL